jgi:hypothetical protein
VTIRAKSVEEIFPGPEGKPVFFDNRLWEVTAAGSSLRETFSQRLEHAEGTDHDHGNTAEPLFHRLVARAKRIFLS